MTRRHVAVIPALGTVSVTYRNLGIENSGDWLPDWFFTRSESSA